MSNDKNNNSNHKTTILKTLLMLSIIPMVLVIGGEVIPAYAQTVWSTDANSNPHILFWDFKPPQCIEADIVKVSGMGFGQVVDVDVDLTVYPLNGNLGGNFAPTGPGYDYYANAAAIITSLPITTDDHGAFADINLIAGPNPGKYNIIINTNNDGIFNPAVDAIDNVDNWGFNVSHCEREDEEPTIEVVKAGKRTRESTSGESVHIEGENLESSNTNKKRKLHVTYYAELSGTTATTITDLSAKSVWSKYVYIGSDGAFTETITWTPDTPGEYNIILDMNNDNTYTPGIDIIDYPAEVGFTVTSDEITSPLIIIPSCESVDSDDLINEPPWIQTFGANNQLDYYLTSLPKTSYCDDAAYGGVILTGDFNGDGYDDIVVGIPLDNVNGKENAGAVNVIYGSAGGLYPFAEILNQDKPHDILGGSDEGDKFGYSLAIGDFNGDGYDDLAVGVPLEDLSGKEDAGAVNVIYGSKKGLTAKNNQIWHQNSLGIKGGIEKSDKFGFSVAAGDFNRDGYDDLAIGVPLEDIAGKENTGIVNVIYGSSSSLTRIDNQIWYQNSPDIKGGSDDNDKFGFSLAVGDFDSDGYDDLAIGVPLEDLYGEDDAGAVNVIYGSDDRLRPYQNQIWYQDSPDILGGSDKGDRFGLSLAVGDFDGNGIDDLAIGVPAEDIGGEDNAGAVNVIYGSFSRLNANQNQIWYQDSHDILGGSDKGDRFGHTITGGDFDGDGYDDLAIGVPLEDLFGKEDAGAVNVIYGSFSRLISWDNEIWHQNSFGIAGAVEKGDAFGHHVAVGDVNGDGTVDLIVGVPFEDIRGKENIGVINPIYGYYSGLRAHPP